MKLLIISICCYISIVSFAQVAPAGSLVAFEDVKGLIGFKNSKGTVIVNPQFGKVSFEGFYWKVSSANKTLSGMMDANGKMLTEIKYDKIEDFIEGVAIVWIITDEDYNYGPVNSFGLINKDGVLITPCRYDQIYAYSNGYAVVSVLVDYDYSVYDFIDRTGKQVTNGRFMKADNFSEEGLAKVLIGDKYGFIDVTGKLVIPAIYSYARSFQDGKADVQLELDGPDITIDITGKPIKN